MPRDCTTQILRRRAWILLRPSLWVWIVTSVLLLAGGCSRPFRCQEHLTLSVPLPAEKLVVRNRLGAQRMVNKDKMERALKNLSKRIGFRTAPGFNERVIFRELFPRGLTLLDLKDIGVKQLNISNVAARQELRDLMKALNLPGVSVDF